VCDGFVEHFDEGFCVPVINVVTHAYAGHQRWETGAETFHNKRAREHVGDAITEHGDRHMRFQALKERWDAIGGFLFKNRFDTEWSEQRP
jgi:nuclear transport factor 2 (NTF2) superfamily protein